MPEGQVNNGYSRMEGAKMGEKIFDYEWLSDGRFALYLRPPKVTILPSEAEEHFRAAQKEFLMALRSLVDAALEREEQEERRRTRTKIEIT